MVVANHEGQLNTSSAALGFSVRASVCYHTPARLFGRTGFVVCDPLKQPVLFGEAGFSMASSKMQARIGEILRLRFAQYEVIENSRPPWLETEDGQRLELDFHIPDLKIAVEVQGMQHYIYTPHFHGTMESFLAQQKRDEAKRSLCDLHGVTLLVIETDDQLIDHLKSIDRDRKTPFFPLDELGQLAEAKKVSFLAAKTRKQRARIKETRAQIVHLRGLIRARTERRETISPKTMRQFYLAYNTLKEQEAKLWRIIVEQCQFYEERVRPWNEENLALRELGGLFEFAGRPCKKPADEQTE